MEDRFNTIAGWVLFSGVVALGLSSVSSKVFHADKPERPEKMGYEIAGVVRSGGGAAKEVPIEALLAKADVAKGEGVFKKCASCHSINAGGANGIGPNLHAIFGKAVGKHAAGFAYSEGLAAVGGNWDWTTMNKWLTNPKGMVAGTKMTFAGLDSGEDRANVMAYMNAQGSNLPLPAAPAEAAPAEGAAVPADAAAKPADGAAPAAAAEPAKK
jgi:cytochrome c